MSDSSKAASQRFQFKKRVCHKTCGLWVGAGKGGYCTASKCQIDYCLQLEKQTTDARDYRNVNTVMEWIEVFAEEENISLDDFIELDATILAMLSNTKQDCYTIAKRIVEGVMDEHCTHHRQGLLQITGCR